MKETFTFEEAAKLLPEGDTIHTFRCPGPNMLVGANWARSEILEAMQKFPIGPSGKVAASMDHGLVLDDGRFLFIETKKSSSAKSLSLTNSG